MNWMKRRSGEVARTRRPKRSIVEKVSDLHASRDQLETSGGHAEQSCLFRNPDSSTSILVNTKGDWVAGAVWRYALDLASRLARDPQLREIPGRAVRVFEEIYDFAVFDS